jgi:hypothetical protein
MKKMSGLAVAVADVHVLRSTRSATDLDIVLRGSVRVLVTPQNGALR